VVIDANGPANHKVDMRLADFRGRCVRGQYQFGSE
jgi:hypothetical protein